MPYSSSRHVVQKKRARARCSVTRAKAAHAPRAARAQSRQKSLLKIATPARPRHHQTPRFHPLSREERGGGLRRRQACCHPAIFYFTRSKKKTSASQNEAVSPRRRCGVWREGWGRGVKRVLGRAHTTAQKRQQRQRHKKTSSSATLKKQPRVTHRHSSASGLSPQNFSSGSSFFASAFLCEMAAEISSTLLFLCCCLLLLLGC